MNSERELQQVLATHLSEQERREFLDHDWDLVSHATLSAGEVVLRRQEPPAADALGRLDNLKAAVSGPISDLTPAYYLASVLQEIAALGAPSALSAFKMEYRSHLETWYFNQVEQLLLQARAGVTARELLAGDTAALQNNAYALADRMFRNWGPPGLVKRDELDQAWLRLQGDAGTTTSTCVYLVTVLDLMDTPMDRGTFARILANCLTWTPRVAVRHREVTSALFELDLTMDQVARDSIGDDSVGFDLPSTHGWHFTHKDETAAANTDTPWLLLVGGDTGRGDHPWHGILRAGNWQAGIRWNNAEKERRFRNIEDMAAAIRSSVVVMLATHARTRSAHN